MVPLKLQFIEMAPSWLFIGIVYIELLSSFDIHDHFFYGGGGKQKRLLRGHCFMSPRNKWK